MAVSARVETKIDQLLDHAKRAEAHTDRALSWVQSTPVTLVIVTAVLVAVFWLGLQF